MTPTRSPSIEIGNATALSTPWCLDAWIYSGHCTWLSANAIRATRPDHSASRAGQPLSGRRTGVDQSPPPPHDERLTPDGCRADGDDCCDGEAETQPMYRDWPRRSV